MPQKHVKAIASVTAAEIGETANIQTCEIQITDGFGRRWVDANILSRAAHQATNTTFKLEHLWPRKNNSDQNVTTDNAFKDLKKVPVGWFAGHRNQRGTDVDILHRYAKHIAYRSQDCRAHFTYKHDERFIVVISYVMDKNGKPDVLYAHLPQSTKDYLAERMRLQKQADTEYAKRKAEKDKEASRKQSEMQRLKDEAAAIRKREEKKLEKERSELARKAKLEREEHDRQAQRERKELVRQAKARAKTIKEV